MANWKNIRGVLKYLETTKDTRKHRFEMTTYFRLLGKDAANPRVGPTKLCEIRDCGTAQCIGGTALALYGSADMVMDVVPTRGFVNKRKRGPIVAANSLFGQPTIMKAAADVLGLETYAADYMFMGRWASKPLQEITREDAIEYLRKAIRRKNVMVSIRPKKGIDY